MKKILALVLALTLALGTFSFAAAAPEDVVGTDYEDAVNKLVYLGIIAGFPDGTYRPAEPVTRAQFAKIIVTALGVGEAAQYAAGATKFADVPADHWATGFINVAVDLGIINGYPDGTFAPENSVTYAEAIKMIVAALGYTPKAEAMGGYPGGYLAIAAEKEISDGVTVVGSLAANRGDIALMIDNALTVPMMVQKTWGQFPEYEEDEDQNLLKKLGVKEIEGRVIAIPRVDSKLDDNELRLGEAGSDNGVYEVIEGVDFELAFGNEVTAYVKKDKVIGLTIESDFFLDAIKVNQTGKELTLVQEDEDYDIADDVVVWVDGEDKEGNIANGNYNYAKVVLNDDGDVAFIDAFKWDGFIVVEEVDEELVIGIDDELDVEDYVIVKGGKAIGLEDLEEGDILFFNDEAEFAEVYNETVVGEIDRVYSDSFKVDGEEIDIVAGWSKYVDDDDLENFTDEIAEAMWDEGEEVTVFVDRFGDAVLVLGETGDAETSTFYAMVIEPVAESHYQVRNKQYYNLDVINEKGEEVNYDVDITVKDLSSVGLRVGDIVKVEVDEDGDVKNVTKLTKYVTKKFEVDDKYVAGYSLQKGTVIFNVQDAVTGAVYDKDEVVVSTLGDADFDEAKGNVYAENGKVVVIVVTDSDKKADEEVYVAVATANAKAIKGTKMFELKVSVDGVKKTYETKDKASLADVAGTVYKGAFLKLTVDENTGEVVDVVVLEAKDHDEDIVTEVIRGKNNSNATLLDAEDGNVVYRLSNATILDAKDSYKVLRMRDLAVGDKVNILLVQEGSPWAIYVVRTAEAGDE